jgi:uncharacterized protein YuzE
VNHAAHVRSAAQDRIFAATRQTARVETIRITDALNVDLAPDGTVYGIELLNANEQLQEGDDGMLVVITDGTGAVTSTYVVASQDPAEPISSGRRHRFT